MQASATKPSLQDLDRLLSRASNIVDELGGARELTQMKFKDAHDILRTLSYVIRMGGGSNATTSWGLSVADNLSKILMANLTEGEQLDIEGHDIKIHLRKQNVAHEADGLPFSSLSHDQIIQKRALTCFHQQRRSSCSLGKLVRRCRTSSTHFPGLACGCRELPPLL